MNQAIRTLALCLVPLATLVGCQATVIDATDGSDQSGDEIESCDSEEANCAEPGDRPAIDPGPSGLVVTWPALGEDVLEAPDSTWLLIFGSERESCADPLASLPHCDVPLTWRAEIPVPAELQYEGAVIDLESLQGVGFGPFYTESIGESDGNCSGGGGTLFGTLEILTIADDSVRVRFTADAFFDNDPSGVRTLGRCD